MDEDGSRRYTTKTVPSSEHGRGLRWRARYVDDEGQQHSKMFERRSAAQAWLDNEVTTKLCSGTYVTPEAGKVTVGAVYASWLAGQGTLGEDGSDPGSAWAAASSLAGPTWRWST